MFECTYRTPQKLGPHLEPDNYSLVWDRLPMAVAFMSIFAVMVAERVKSSIGVALLWPLIAIGIASILWWIWKEHIGQGDQPFQGGNSTF